MPLTDTELDAIAERVATAQREERERANDDRRRRGSGRIAAHYADADPAETRERRLKEQRGGNPTPADRDIRRR
jgi:hypothetical protein